MRTSLRISLVVALATPGFATAQSPYVGKWKLNPAKSDFGQLTVVYEPASDGGFKATMDGVSYTFKMDGKDTSTPWGTTAAWKNAGENAWEVVNRSNGQLLSTDTLRISADGNTLIVDSRVVKATGETSSDRMTLQRVSGGPGLAGRWQTAKLNSSSPANLEIAATGTNGLVLKFVDMNSECDAKFDGKDYPVTGPTFPSGWTCALPRRDERSFDVTWKKDGNLMYRSTLTASADGQTLTETGGAAGTNEKVRIVYDRQ